MKLTDYIIDIGRPIAYYPNLKKITGSTTASILLCQLLYWTSRTNDGWIWKDSFDLEEETGLTPNEQRTAKRILIEKNLVKAEYKRLDHQYRYKVNQDVLNEMWEKHGGKKTKTIPMQNQEKQEEQEELWAK